jgi:adenine-specific DNA-methyltransferase
MRRRLIVIRELLAPDGSIYIHIGHQMMAHLKVLADEIFGAENFRNIIIRRKCSSKNYTSKSLPNIHDYILFYTKGKDYIWNPPGAPPSAEWINKEYTKCDAKGRYKLVPIHAPGIRAGETGKAWRDMMPPPGKHWQLTPGKLDQLDLEGSIHWSKNGNPRRKVYLTEDKQQNLTDYWSDFRDAHHQSIKITGYPTEKNFDMIRTIIKASSNPGDIVCDCFMGSGTTLEAAQKEGRKWLGIDSSPEAIRTTLNRLTGGRKAMGDFVAGQSEEQVLFELDPPTAVRLMIESRYAKENRPLLASLFNA